MVRAVRQWKVGPTTEEGVMVGPLQNEIQYNKVKILFEKAQRERYVVTFGGEVEDKHGFFLEPTVIDNPSPECALATEEQFVSIPDSSERPH